MSFNSCCIVFTDDIGGAAAGGATAPGPGGARGPSRAEAIPGAAAMSMWSITELSRLPMPSILATALVMDAPRKSSEIHIPHEKQS